MDEYLSERQQIEQLRGVVRENAPWAVSGVLIGVGLLVGWQQWQGWRERQGQAAGALYNQSLEALARGDREAAAKLVGQLQQGLRRTPYVDLGQLALARYNAENDHLADAEHALEDVMLHTKDESLALVARLRLARVQRAEGKPDAALATLAAAPAGAAAPAFAEVRGDILQDKGDRDGARAAYAEALASTTTGIPNRERLELELAALGGPPPPAAAPSSGSKP